MIHGFVHILGLDNASGVWYLFWSGVFGDLAFMITPFVLLRKHNCHVRGCYRVGTRPVQGTSYVVCRKHHPHDRPSAQEIHDTLHGGDK